MAKAPDERVEYDSDPDEVNRLLGLRRREAASDDDEEDRSLSESENLPVIRRVVIHSDDDSDGQGAAAVYGEDLDEGLEDEEDDETYEEACDQEPEEFVEENLGGQKGIDINEPNITRTDEINEDRSMQQNHQNCGEEEEVVEDGKKTQEPFAVPTAGAFYMHDDRFRDNTVGRNRRTLGGRKLWESRDDQKWGHDKYEEMNVPDRNHGHGRRMGRGGYRGRGGKTRIPDRGHNMSPASSRSFNNGDTQNYTGKGIKGRGPRKYENAIRTIRQGPSVVNKYPPKVPEMTSSSSSAKTAQPSSNKEIQVAPNMKPFSLSSSSPPFYPSGRQDSTERKEIRAASKVLPTHEEQSNVLRGKKAVDSSSLAKLKSDNTVKYSSPGSSYTGQGKGNVASTPMGFSSFSSSNQSPTANRAPAKPSNGENLIASSEPADGDKVKNALVPKHGNTIQGGRGSFPYSGNGADQKFPTFLPVMQFGGQLNNGMGVPAVGMAFPGYVGQSQLGIGSSEMTWLPVLTGAAGALGASYCPPYLSVDNSYHTRASSQLASSASSSKEDSVNSFNSDFISYIRNDNGNGDPGLRQHTRRQYETDMKMPRNSS